MEFISKILKFIQKNIALSLLSANILILLFLFISKDPFRLREKSYDKASAFFPISENDITKISLERKGLSDVKYELIKTPSEWSINLKGKEYRGETDKINSFVKAVLNTKKFTVVTSSPDKAKDFGFNEDEIKIEVFAGSDSKGHISLGSLNSESIGTHIKWNDSKEIYLVEGNLKSLMGNFSFNHFMDKRISPSGLSSDDLTYFKLERNGKEIEIKKENTWNLISPTKTTIANEDMSNLLSKLSTLIAEEVLISDLDLNGVEPYPFEFTYSFKEKSGKTNSILISSEGLNKTNNYYFVKKNKDDIVYKVSEYSIKSILDFDPTKAPKK